MEIETIGPYSPNIVYGQLSSPFMPKTITVNSKTPYDEVDENSNSTEAFSRKFFKGKPIAKMKISISGDEEQKGNPLEVNAKENNSPNINESNNIGKDSELFKQNIVSFSKSSTSSKDIVNNSLKRGYSTDEAIVIDNARKAYEKSILFCENPAETLSSRAYKVV